MKHVLGCRRRIPSVANDIGFEHDVVRIGSMTAWCCHWYRNSLGQLDRMRVSLAIAVGIVIIYSNPLAPPDHFAALKAQFPDVSLYGG